MTKSYEAPGGIYIRDLWYFYMKVLILICPITIAPPYHNNPLVCPNYVHLTLGGTAKLKHLLH